MNRGLLSLAFAELRQAGLRSGLTALAIAAGILAISFFAGQINRQHATLLVEYEAAGAATLIAELAGVADREIDELASAARGLESVKGAEAPYNGAELGFAADTSFLVFQNDKQQEFLGARLTALGIAKTFDLARDYYANFTGAFGDARMPPLGIPLLVTNGSARPPVEDEILVPAVIAEYVGVRPGALANIELIYNRKRPDGPITRRIDQLHVIGTFDTVGPDEGRFAPFWRLAARGSDVLTVRRPDGVGDTTTTLPVVLSAGLLRDFTNQVRQRLEAHDLRAFQTPDRRQLILRINAISDVASAEGAFRRLLQQNGLREACGTETEQSFCLRWPERNNFLAALQEQTKFGAGAAFFIALLLSLVAVGVGGLQIQATITHWHDYAILQAVGFAPGQLLAYHALRLCIVMGGAVAAAGLIRLALPPTYAAPIGSFAAAAGLSIFAALASAMPLLLWSLGRSPAERLRELT